MIISKHSLCIFTDVKFFSLLILKLLKYNTLKPFTIIKIIHSYVYTEHLIKYLKSQMLRNFTLQNLNLTYLVRTHLQ